ncbi:MAG: Ca2+/H+ antiporter, family [Frankiales bacterium]|nr:Ca2+/H+ antiporter, family [Frankiales bacterium]
MNLTVALTVFGLIFVGELPDKSALASLVLGSRYRPSWVFAGVAAAFAAHMVLAVAAGELLTLLPHRMLEVIVGALFLAGAVLLLRERGEEGENAGDTMAGKPATFTRVASTSFVIVAVAEFGDLTQIIAANLAAKYNDPITVGVSSILALWAVAGLAIVGGKNLLRVIPLKALTRTAAVIMLVLAVVTLIAAIRG